MKKIKFAGMCLVTGLILVLSCKPGKEQPAENTEKIVISLADVATVALLQEAILKESISPSLAKDLLTLRDVSGNFSINFYGAQQEMSKASMATATLLPPVLLLTTAKAGLCCPCPPSSRTCPCTMARTYMIESSAANNIQISLVPTGNTGGTAQKFAKDSTSTKGFEEFTMPSTGLGKGDYTLQIKGKIADIPRDSYELNITLDENKAMSRKP